MKKKKFSIPLKNPLYHNFTVHYLSTDSNNDILKWLVKKRCNLYDNNKTIEYFANEMKYSQQIQDIEIKRVDIILCPPSNDNYYLPYLLSLSKKFVNAVNISSRFTRDPGVSAGNCSATYEEIVNNYHYHSCGDLSGKKVLIVDDSFATGKTAAIILKKLESSNVLSSDVELVCPLLIEQ